ncbi:MAG: hypothetical protein M0P31_13770 [Solirubrobacteraceae bacterium]|nr:hypothetical protein [Solirubrobacteraceae bacterium]
MSTNATTDSVLLDAQPAPPRVPWGLSTLLGLLGALGVIAGAIDANDTVTVVSGVGALASMLGRQAQAIALGAQHAAQAAKPWVDALADADLEPDDHDPRDLTA